MATQRKRKQPSTPTLSTALQKQHIANDIHHAVIVEQVSKLVVEEGDDFQAMIVAFYKPSPPASKAAQAPLECTRCHDVHFCRICRRNCVPTLCKSKTSRFFGQYIVSCREFDKTTKTFCKGCKFTVCEAPTELTARGEEKKMPCCRCGKVFYAHGRNMIASKSLKKNICFHSCNEKLGDHKFCRCIGFSICDAV